MGSREWGDEYTKCTFTLFPTPYSPFPTPFFSFVLKQLTKLLVSLFYIG
jgi:hypothetical protein